MDYLYYSLAPAHLPVCIFFTLESVLNVGTVVEIGGYIIVLCFLLRADNGSCYSTQGPTLFAAQVSGARLTLSTFFKCHPTEWSQLLRRCSEDQDADSSAAIGEDVTCKSGHRKSIELLNDFRFKPNLVLLFNAHNARSAMYSLSPNPQAKAVRAAAAEWR